MTLDAWANFFFAQVGASASLAGLLFVAVSVNHARILELGRMAERAMEVLVLLATVMIVASLGLVPGQPLWLFGAELIVFGLAAFAVGLGLQRTYLAAIERVYRRSSLQVVWVSRLSALLVVAAGAEVIVRGDPIGLYFLPAGVLLSFIAAMIHAWVLMIEISR